MAKSGMNPKTLQYLMGHSDISVTLNTYTHVKYEDVAAEVTKLVVVYEFNGDNPTGAEICTFWLCVKGGKGRVQNAIFVPNFVPFATKKSGKKTLYVKLPLDEQKSANPIN